MSLLRLGYRKMASVLASLSHHSCCGKPSVMLRTARWRDIPRNGGLPLTASEDLRTADNHNSVEAPHDSPDCNHMTQDHSGSSQIPDPQEPGDNIFVVVVS